jgi:hypothetical protein
MTQPIGLVAALSGLSRPTEPRVLGSGARKAADAAPTRPSASARTQPRSDPMTGSRPIITLTARLLGVKA